MQHQKSSRHPSVQRDFREKLSDATGVAIPPPTENKPWANNNPNKKPRETNWNKNFSDSLPEFPMVDKRELVKDGVDHINCTNVGLTHLGKSLSPTWRSAFKHDYAGPFTTMEGFLWYLQTENDEFRSVSGYHMVAEIRKVRAEDRIEVDPELVTMLLADAIWQQIHSNQNVIRLMKESTVPFDMYYVDSEYSGVRMRVRNASLYVRIFELCREALQKKAAYPDFTQLFPHGGDFGAEAFNEHCKTTKVGNNIPMAYKQAVKNFTFGYFESLIDHAHLAEMKLRTSQKNALKASKQILKETSKEIAKSLKDRGFPEDNQEDLEEANMTPDAPVIFNQYPSTGEQQANKPHGKYVGLPASEDADTNESAGTPKEATEITPVAQEGEGYAAPVPAVNEDKTVGPMDITSNVSHLKLVASEPVQLQDQVITQEMIEQKIIDRVKDF